MLFLLSVFWDTDFPRNSMFCSCVFHVFLLLHLQCPFIDEYILALHNKIRTKPVDFSEMWVRLSRPISLLHFINRDSGDAPAATSSPQLLSLFSLWLPSSNLHLQLQNRFYSPLQLQIAPTKIWTVLRSSQSLSQCQHKVNVKRMWSKQALRKKKQRGTSSLDTHWLLCFPYLPFFPTVKEKQGGPVG